MVNIHTRRGPFSRHNHFFDFYSFIFWQSCQDQKSSTENSIEFSPFDCDLRIWSKLYDYEFEQEFLWNQIPSHTPIRSFG
jgi:hypothetical protein